VHLGRRFRAPEGVGIPYGIAAKLAQPERPVVVITGDGSFGLGAMEFDTAVRHGVPIVCVIGNDTAWGQVRHGQEAAFGPDRTPGTGLGWRSYEKVVAACINVPTDPSAVFRGMTAMCPITSLPADGRPPRAPARPGTPCACRDG